MSYQQGGGPPSQRRTAPIIARPLIARPQYAAPQQQQQGPPQSQLGFAIAGALGGMGYGTNMAWQQQNTGGLPQGGAASYGGWSMGGGPPTVQGQYYPHQQHQHQQPQYHQQQQYGDPTYQAAGYGYPPASQPLSQQPYQQHLLPPRSMNAPQPPLQHPLPRPPHQHPLPPHPSQHYSIQPSQQHQQSQHSSNASAGSSRTTAEGYTISEAYVPPPPPGPAASRVPHPKPPRPPQSQQQPRQRGPRNGRGPGGEARPSDSGPSNGGTPPQPSNTSGNGNGLPPKPVSAAGPPPNAPIVHKCQREGCNFSGSKKSVREHEEDRHLIYAPGKEPKPWVPSAKAAAGARIEGTNISLDSPEAIAKWIEERKKKWPSHKVVDDKEKLRAERIAAGLEAPPRSGRGGRGGRGRGDRGGMRGRGRGRGGFGGGSYNDDEDLRPTKRAKVDSDSDSGDSSGSSLDSDDPDDPEEDNNDDDAPPEASSSKVPVPSLFPSTAADSDPVLPPLAEGPRLHPSRLAREDGDENEESTPDAQEVERKVQVVCKYWRQGNCGLGDKCHFLHELPPNSSIAPSAPKRKRPAPPPVPRNPFARADPFAQVAERDIAHVVSDILHAVDFLSSNDWLRAVEIRVGQIEEEGGIEELGQDGVQAGLAVAAPLVSVEGGEDIDQVVGEEGPRAGHSALAEHDAPDGEEADLDALLADEDGAEDDLMGLDEHVELSPIEDVEDEVSLGIGIEGMTSEQKEEVSV